MAPVPPPVSLTLSYPIYSSDFDPQNDGFLFVGGGGGAGRSGVKNRITLIDTSRKQEIKEVVDIDLSSNEDSVSSLAVAQSEDYSAVVFAGINSSIDEQKQGRNDHLRSFVLQYPQRRSADGKTVEIPDTPGEAMTEALCKSPLFTPDPRPNPETYQRILRLSRPNKEHGRRLGAITTGLAPIGEVMIFDASRPRIDQSDVRQRINLGKEQEAADVDIIEANDYEYYVVYCTDYEIHVCKVPFDKEAPTRSPYLLYETPQPEPSSKEKRRPQFRSLRFLTPRLLLVLLNLPNKSGAELFLLEISENPLLGTVALRKSLHRGIKSAPSLAVSLLSAPTPSQNIQHVIAVAGQDISLTILTIDHNPRSRSQLAFKQYAFFRNPHPIQMTSLAFSYFNPPHDPTKASPQYLKLASTSMSSTVVVHTFPLVPHPSAVTKRKPSDPPSRYVLQQPPSSSQEPAALGLTTFTSLIVIALGAFILQAIMEIRGMEESIGARTWYEKPLHEKLSLPAMLSDWQFPVITDKLPPIEFPLRRAYKVVEEKAPTDGEELKDNVETGAEKLKNSVQSGAEKLTDASDEVIKEIKEHIPTDTDELKEDGHQAASAIRDGAESVPDELQDAAYSAGQRIRESIPRDIDDLRDTAHHTARKFKHPARHHHRRLRDLLRHRLHLLESREDEEIEDPDIDTPSFQLLHDDDLYDPEQRPSRPHSAYSDSFPEALETSAIVIRDRGHDPEERGPRLAGEIHRSEEEAVLKGRRGGGRVRKWEDLRPHEKRGWMRRLEDAGVWTLREGDAVLKGIFFSELAGAVAGAVRAGL